MGHTLTWLHLSDIHFHPSTAWRDNASRDALLAYLRTDPSLRPDLIFCTGDIAFGETPDAPLAGQYEKARAFFEQLRAIWNLPKERLFVVPGNHDINRDSVNKLAQSAMRQLAEKAADHAADINQQFDKPSKEIKDALARLAEYAAFVQHCLPHQADPGGRHCYAKRVEINGLKIGVAGFNSAWSCADDQDDRHLWMAAQWQFNAARSALQEADLRIGLIHHPVDWLNLEDRNVVTRRLAADFDFWLHGHTHDAWVEPGQAHTVIGAGAVGAQEDEEFGINWVRLDLAAGTGVVYLHAYSPRDGDWTIKAVAKHAPKAEWPLKLPEKLRRTSAEHPLNLACALGFSGQDALMEDAAAKLKQQPVLCIYDHPTPKPLRRAELPKSRTLYGRDQDLETIAHALKPTTRTFIIVIDGPGGIGKTALAVEAAHRAEGFAEKIYLSAKRRYLTPKGEIERKDFLLSDFDTLLDELGRALGDEQVPRSPSGPVRAREARRALEGRKALLVLDNLEDWPASERDRLYAFTEELPEGCKVLITSRRRDDAGAKNLRLNRLSTKAALELLAEQAEDNPVLNQASLKEREDLVNAAAGNPLLMLWAVGQLGRPGAVCRSLPEASARVRVGMDGNDPLEFIFGHLAQTFSQDEQACLAALLPFSDPLPVATIAELAELPVHRAESALETLAACALLTADAEHLAYALLPLPAVYVRRRLPTALIDAAEERLTQRVYDCVTRHGYQNHDKFEKIEAEWVLVAASLPLFLQGENQRLQTLCDALVFFLDFSGRWEEWLDLSLKAEVVALAAGDYRKAGWRAYQAGWVHTLRKEAGPVQDCAQRCAEHWQQGAEQEGAVAYAREQATALRLRGIGHRLEKDYPAALAAYRNALEIHRGLKPESKDVALSLNDIAGIERFTGDYPAAERDYREALRIAQKIDYREGIAIFFGNLAELALDRQQWAEAESQAREALVLSEAVGRLELIASNNRRIAQALLRQNQAEAALPFAQKAVDIYAQLPSPDEAYARQLLQACEQALGL